MVASNGLGTTNRLVEVLHTAWEQVDVSMAAEKEHCGDLGIDQELSHLVWEGLAHGPIQTPLVEVQASPETATPAPAWADADFECRHTPGRRARRRSQGAKNP